MRRNVNDPVKGDSMTSMTIQQTSNNPATLPSRDLYVAWQVLRNEQPRLRARNAAQHLSVSEAELLACRVSTLR